MSEFLAWRPPKLREIISNGILHPQGRLVIHGSFKTWKSMLAMHTGFCISTGTPWFGFTTEKEEVLIVQVEVSEISYHQRCIKYNFHNFPKDADTSHLWVASENFMKFDKPYGMADLDRDIAKCGAKVIIIDPLYKVISGDLNNGKEVMALLDNFDLLIDKYKCSFIIIHHERKMHLDKESGFTSSGGAEEMTGSQYISNWADTVIGISRLSEDEANPVKLKVRFNAMRHAEKFPSPMFLTVNRDDLIFTHDIQAYIPPIVQKFLDMKKDDRGVYKADDNNSEVI